MEYTITQNEKATLHRVRNDLESMTERWDVRDTTQAFELSELIGKLNTVVDPMIEEDSKRMNDMIDYYRNCQEIYNLKTVWSMWKDPSSPENTVRMSDPHPYYPHPYSQKCEVEYGSSMGDDKTYTVAIDGDSWSDVWKACDKLIEMSGDDHHVFIENLREQDGKLILQTGS